MDIVRAKKILREIKYSLFFLGLIILIAIFSVKKIQRREDLVLLQIDFTDIVLKSKICFDKGGVVQDASRGEEGKVFICNKQDIITDTFPILKKMSHRNLPYKYLSSQECFAKKCDKYGEGNNKAGRINIGLGHRLVMSCNIAEGICNIK